MASNRVLIVISIYLVTTLNGVYGQLRVGLPTGTVNPSASLEVGPGPYPTGSPFRGIIAPNMTISQRNQIQNPSTGIFLYNTDNKQIEVNVGTPSAPVWGPAVGSGTAWSINGNSGTNDKTNFIGTPDNVPLSFRVFNQPAGRIDHILFNLGLGFFSINPSTTGTYNTAVGSYTLRNNTSGIANTAVGAGALTTNTSGTGNTGIGHDAMIGNINGRENTGIGQNALRSNTSGISNTALGADAMNDGTSASDNTALGASALYSINTGNQNTAAGALALFSNTTGYNNSALGNYALQNNVGGYLNIGVGHNAGPSSRNVSVNNSTAIGAGSVIDAVFSVAIGANATINAGSGLNTLVGANSSTGNNVTNSTAIGARSAVNSSNTIVLGDANISSLRCNVQSISSLSDARIKENIKTNVPGLAFITKLRPVTYTVNKTKEAALVGYKNDNIVSDTTTHSGFIAQEVERAAFSAGYNFEGVKSEEGGRYYTVGYSLFVVPLVQAVKELNDEVKLLKEKLKKSENAYDQLSVQLSRLQETVNSIVTPQADARSINQHSK
ncbi:hypothetical protein FAES_4969 [Fibrella aestuarina BUZ 2]|uniref:Peptidase S74 domain-containing protein n=1 Tax=Fibrella aestuarina BUZ 2 TaxID=1166018 RepID=I0KFR5_9BACT|nr:tail fiber domain-containing protein [Fibrella aestuarina]CCH02968.1 hypothetical protein FAES_4969 [Fibrella aestuarina BUZ 2]